MQLPPLGLGTAQLGNLFVPLDDETAVSMVRHALMHGVAFFDTAPLYGAGESERRLGLALRGVERNSYVLASKLGRRVTAPGHVAFDLSADGIRRGLEESLRRLGVDWLDIAHIHDPDDHEEAVYRTVLPTMLRLREEGLIRAIGAGMNQWPMLQRFAEHGGFDCFLLAGRYTLLEQSALPLLELCQSRGLRLILGGVYNSGLLATGVCDGARYNYRAAEGAQIARVHELEQLCAAYGVPLPALALAFARAHPAVVSLVVGADSPAQVDAMVRLFYTPIPAGLAAELRGLPWLNPAASLLFEQSVAGSVSDLAR